MKKKTIPDCEWKREQSPFALCWCLLCLIAIVALAPFPPDMSWLREVLVVQAAMPAGVFAIVIVKSYDGDTGIALRTILVTLAGCLITMPTWLSLGLRMLCVK